jgi:hypothetical protein
MRKLIVLAVVLMLVGVVGSADITQKTAYTHYQPAFADWVPVYLNSALSAVNTPAQYLQVSAKKGTTGIRFDIIGRYSNDQAQWGAQAQQSVYRFLPVAIKNWNLEGFAISMDDFDIDIRPY